MNNNENLEQKTQQTVNNQSTNSTQQMTMNDALNNAEALRKSSTQERINSVSLEDIDAARIKTRNRTLISILIVIGVPAVLFLVLSSNEKLQSILPTISFIVALIICIIWVNSAKAVYSKKYKDYFVLRGLTNIFTDLYYEPSSGISSNVIYDTEMMTIGDRYSSNDYVMGKYKDIKFEQSDVHIEEEHEYTDSDGHTQRTYVTIFRGRWLIFDFNKEFKANIEVCHKRFYGARRGRGLFSSNKYNKVKMESEAFNKEFKVYAQSEHEAFYILTPALMEKIQRLTGSVKGRFLFCFVDKKLHIGLNNNTDSFEAPTVFKRINEEKELNKVSNDMKIITMFVDELNLDNDLFKK